MTTHLIVAAHLGELEIATLLLDTGAAINRLCNINDDALAAVAGTFMNGTTALMVASHAGLALGHRAFFAATWRGGGSAKSC
jgi:hypothetical protein